MLYLGHVGLWVILLISLQVILCFVNKLKKITVEIYPTVGIAMFLALWSWLAHAFLFNYCR